MNNQPRIESLDAKKMIGLSIKMSMAQNKIGQLWSSFMPRRKEIVNAVGTDLYSMQYYDGVLDYRNFNPHLVFEQRAAIEVTDFEQVPDGFETFDFNGGLYAVFLHQGLASDFQKTMEFIYGQWLPDSGYSLDHRGHFEVLGEKYKNNDPTSEEEVWVPIVSK